MIDQIILNDTVRDLDENILPCLINYEEKSGGSHYSVTLVANLFKQGFKILFFTAYPMAKENFIEQVGLDEDKIAFVLNQQDLSANSNKQCLILESGNQELLDFTLNNLPDINERVILIKNIEKFEDKIISQVLSFDKIILSGHLDECSLKESIIQKEYKNIVLFNNPKVKLSVLAPDLEKYSAYFWTKEEEGITKIIK